MGSSFGYLINFLTWHLLRWHFLSWKKNSIQKAFWVKYAKTSCGNATAAIQSFSLRCTKNQCAAYSHNTSCAAKPSIVSRSLVLWFSREFAPFFTVGNMKHTTAHDSSHRKIRQKWSGRLARSLEEGRWSLLAHHRRLRTWSSLANLCRVPSSASDCTSAPPSGHASEKRFVGKFVAAQLW